jgi:hypothetical protein
VFISLHLVQVIETAEAAGRGEAETMWEHGLGFVGFGDAAEGDLPWWAAARRAGVETRCARVVWSRAICRSQGKKGSWLWRA